MVLTEKDKDMICSAYKDGKSVEILANTYRVSKQYIYVVLHKRGVLSSKKTKKKNRTSRAKVCKPEVARSETTKSMGLMGDMKTLLTSILIHDGNVQTITTTDKEYASEIELRWRAVPNIKTHAFGDLNGKAYTVVYYLDDKGSEKTQDKKVFESSLDVVGLDEDYGFYVKVPIPKELADDVNDAVIDGRAKVKVVWE